MAGQQSCKGDDQHPGVNTVKQEGDDGFSAGAEGKIGAVGECAQRHDQSGNNDEDSGKLLDGLLGIVNGREKPSQHDHDDGDDRAAGHAEKDHLIVCVLCLLLFACAEKLSHHDGDAATQLYVHDIEQVADGGGDILCGNHLKASCGIALGDHGHSACPEHFIQHKGRSLLKNINQDGAGDPKAPVGSHNIEIFVCVGMRPDDHDQALDKAGDNRGNGRALNAHGGNSSNSEDQNVVKHQVGEHGCRTGDHGNQGLTRLPDGVDIGLPQGKRNQSDHHDGKIFPSIFKCEGDIAHASRIAQIQGNQLRIKETEKQQGKGGDGSAGIELETKGIALSLVVALSVKLGTKNPGTGHAPENADIKDEHQLIDNGNP